MVHVAVVYSFVLLYSVLWYRYAQSPPPHLPKRKGGGKEVSELSRLYYGFFVHPNSKSESLQGPSLMECFPIKGSALAFPRLSFLPPRPHEAFKS